ncbi:hypothetical protein OEZ86_013294 [Tetradesmus obliquus]|nr:hypothetical protein OEZ86_013294 [Tetradesmus obliquus]
MGLGKLDVLVVAADGVGRRLGDPGAVPSAVAAAMLGMRAGGRRRVLVPPGNWTAEQTGPPRPSFGAARRWDTHRGEALLFEAQLVRVSGGG